MATKPGEGASLTLGEAAAYARGRTDGLREIARLRFEVEKAEADAYRWEGRCADERAECDKLRAEVAALRADLALCREREGATGLEYRGG